MKVPLIAKAVKTGLRIYHNGKFEFTPFPFKPFNLLERSAFPEFLSNPVEVWNKLPVDKKTEYVRVNFDSTTEQREFIDRHAAQVQSIYKNRYTEQLYITEPDFVLNYPHEEKLTVMFWDIETRTVGDDVFPKPDKQPIICIGFSIWNYNPDGTKEKIVYKLINSYDEKLTDLYILQDFVEAIKEFDPDVIAGYNSNIFDFPYFYNRCKLRKVSMAGVGREEKSPFISDRGDIYINGRIHYDIYLKVMKDQSLYGLKDKSLKTLARHYEAPLDAETDIELEDAIFNTEKVRTENPDLLWSYQEADVIRTEHVGAVYIRNDITLAEKVKVPLIDTMNSYASFIPKIFLARNFYQNQLISTETNFSKYNSKTGTLAQFRRSSDGKELKFQGALVGLYKHGKFEDTYKLDFTSMYPSAICTFNLGPDTTKLIDVKPFTGTYGFKRDSRYNWYRVPDENFGVDLIIRVKNNVDGILKKEIKMLWDERKGIKGEMKVAPKDEVPMLDSQQLAIKIILNSIYGIQGLRSSTYGDMITGLAITAMCRWTTTKTIQKYEDVLVELDSVTGDTPVWIKNTETNLIDIWPIEDIHHGTGKNYELVEPFETLTRSGWAKINYSKRHEVAKDIYRTRISSGFVDVTSDHSLFNINEEELKPTDIEVKKTKIELCEYDMSITDPIITIDSDEAWMYGFISKHISIESYLTKYKTMKTKLILPKRYKDSKNRIIQLLNTYLNPKFKCRFAATEHKHEYEIIVWGRNSLQVYEYLIKYLYTKNGYVKVPPCVLNNKDKVGDAFIGGLLNNYDYSNYPKVRQKLYNISTSSKVMAAGVQYLFDGCNINLISDNKILKCVKRNPSLFDSEKIVISNNIISSESQIVYDISTDDGTFVSALGDIVLHNTDGLAIDTRVSEEDTNKWLDELMIEHYNITDNYMQMELDIVGPAYFCKMKNYVVEIEGHIHLHGSSLKSSRQCKIQDRARDLAIEYWFNSKSLDEVLREAYDFSNTKISDYEYRVKLSKPLDEYDDKTGQIAFLSEQYKSITQTTPVVDTTLHYVISTKTLSDERFKKFYQKKTGDNYKHVKLVTSVDEIDKTYYVMQISKMLKKFRIERDQQISMFNVLGIDDTPSDIELNTVKYDF